MFPSIYLTVVLAKAIVDKLIDALSNTHLRCRRLTCDVLEQACAHVPPELAANVVYEKWRVDRAFVRVR